MTGKQAERIVSWGVLCILLATYWLTVAPAVSYWDCPEYVSAAWKLEVGHPPGNPTWMLVERVVTMLAPSGKEAALLVNMSSGLFTALAAFFLAKTIFMGAGWVSDSLKQKRWKLLTQSVAAASGALAFGWCDSVWYSAVEAEVYAMSIFMTSLCVWLMVRWAFCNTRPTSTRYLILLAYLFGLSLGIHQLNLLCIPALAIIWSIKRGIRKWWKVLAVFILSLGVVGVILCGIMPSTIAIASEIELLAVNTLGLPYLSGVVIYVLLLGISLLVALTATSHSHNPGVLAIAVFPAILLSGIFIYSENFATGTALTAIVSLLLVRGHNFSARRLNICMWMLALLLTGYSSYALIPIRGAIHSPANSSMPGNPFSFAFYQAREQYGGTPLLYGHTPYSKEMIREEFLNDDGKPTYRRSALERKHRVTVRKEGNARIADPYRMLTKEDSLFNEKALKKKGDAYVVRSYTVKPVLTPELNMWFPRITSRDPADLQSFADWAGMTKETMTEVITSEVIDSAGNYNGKLLADGTRKKHISYRPTYLQSLKMLLTYQTGYMYFRYLLWNFMGRQNDEHSTGEVEHGNFITGINVLDNLMLGAEDALPSRIGRDNKGRNSYFLLPFLLGLAGIVALCCYGKRGHKVCLATAMLFIMTGIAIVIYLNQSPGEPRERDYSYLGSYLAFCIWIGFGAFGLMRLTGKYAPVAAIVPLFSAVWMCIENYDDHDRSGRYAASNIAANILNSLSQDAIIFVDGDNGTFPLWYAQEVEGVRKDIRVINLAYLGMPQYAASMMRDWDGAKGVQTTLQREDVIYGALQFPKLSDNYYDSIPNFHIMLRELAESPSAETRYRKVWIPDASGDSIIYPLSNITKTKGGKGLDFRKLMIFDILATNSAAENPRSVYWLRGLPGRHFIGLDSLATQGLFATKYGLSDAGKRETEYLNTLTLLSTPNTSKKNVYLDGTPASRISTHRAALLMASQEMLHAGKLNTALKLAICADTLPGYDERTYTSLREHDTIFVTRREMSTLMRNLADSLSTHDSEIYSSDIAHLRKRAAILERQDSIYKDEWERYYRSLPPRLRPMVSR